MIIAVDFDGTIVKHRFPRIGPPIPDAIETLKKFQQECHILILWTVRENELLNDAVEYCRNQGLEFYAINSNHPEETSESSNYSRKSQADIFIDDRILGGLPDRNKIYNMIHSKQSQQDVFFENLSNQELTKKKSFWQRLLG